MSIKTCSFPQYHILHYRSKYLTENSYSVCEDLVYGRMSFRGANPEVEKMMKKMERSVPVPTPNQEMAEEQDADVSAQEIVRGPSLNQTIANKFRKRQRYSQPY